MIFYVKPNNMSNACITINTGNCPQGNDELIQLINQKFDQIMASIQQLSAEVGQLRTQVDNFQAAIDTEQHQVTDAINALNASIQQLQQQITDGGTAEERQAVLDQLVGIKDSLTSAQEDLSSTIPDTNTGGTTDATNTGTGTTTDTASDTL